MKFHRRRHASSTRRSNSARRPVLSRRSGTLEMLERREMLSGEPVSAWHNNLNPKDVNFDQRVSAADVMVIVNDLLRNGGAHALSVDQATPLSSLPGAANPKFVDVNNDGRASALDMMIVVNELLASNNISVTTIVTDLAGNPITQISVGAQFKVQTIVQDIRNPPESMTIFQGVNGAGADVFYNSALSSIDSSQTPDINPFFNFEKVVNLSTPGHFRVYGASTSTEGVGNAPQFLFSVVMTATTSGIQTFTPTSGSDIDHPYSVFLLDPPLPDESIVYAGTTLEILSQPGFSVSGVSASETNVDHPVNFTVTLSQSSAETTTVVYNTTDGTATVADNDYVATSGTLTFAPGQTTALIPVTVRGDLKVESDETFNVVLSNPSSNATLVVNTAVGTIINDDVLGILSITGSTVDNVPTGTTTATFTVTLAQPPAGVVTVQYATANDSAIAGVDYIAKTGTLTFTPGGSLTQTVSVTILGDSGVDDVDRFFVNLSNPSENASISTGQAAILINPVNSAAQVSIGTNVSKAEGNSGQTAFVFTVSLSAPSVDSVVVSYATSDITATAGSDYTATSGTLTFTPQQTTKLITVQVLGDTTAEANETFNLTLSNATGAVISGGPAVGTIVDDDGPATITVGDALVSAGSTLTEAVFTVSISGAVTEPVTVGFGTSDGSATSGLDYLPVSGNLQFLPGGPTSKEVHVTILSSSQIGPDKTFFLNLSSASPPGVIIADDQGTGTIITQGLTISDATIVEGNSGISNALFTVKLSRALQQPVTVAYNSFDGTATLANGDYQQAAGTLTFAPGTSVQVITVAVVGDTTKEPNENFQVRLSNATGVPIFQGEGTGTIINDDGSKVSYRLVLTDLAGNPLPLSQQLDINDEFYLKVFVQDVGADPTGIAQAFIDVSYDESLVDVIGTVEFGTAFPNLTEFDFEPGLLNDFGGFGPTSEPLPDPTVEHLLYSVKFRATDNGLVSFVGSVNEADLELDHGTLLYLQPDVDPVPSAQMTVENRAINIGANVIAISDATANESGQMVFTVTRFLPTNQTATVVYSTINGTAVAGQDYTAKNGTLTFAPGTTQQLVTVNLINDTLDEPNENFLVVLSQPTGASISGNPTGTGTIIDDDNPVVVSVSGGSASEGQGVVFNVSLSAPSGKTVTVVYATTGVGSATSGSDYTPTLGTLTFAPGITQRSVTVNTVGDILLEGNETFQLALSSPSQATLGTATAQGIIVDVPPAGISGYVYTDLNGNGLKDANETGIQGAIVTATNTQTGVSKSVTTGADGSYLLVGLIPGNYTLKETQPGFYLDGRDTRYGVDSPLNDQFVGISLEPSEAESGYNFGELGIRGDFISAFINRRALLASAVVGGTFAPNINLPGTVLNLKTGDMWVSFDGGWSGLRQIEALFNSGQGTATMRLYNSNLQEIAVSSPTANGAVLLYTGQVGLPYFLKISGSNANVTVQISTPPAMNLTATTDNSSTQSSNSSSSNTSSSTPFVFNRTASATPMTAAPAADPLVDADGTDGDEAFAEEEDWLLASLLS